MNSRFPRFAAFLALLLGLLVTPTLLPGSVAAQDGEERAMTLEIFTCPPGVDVQALVPDDCTALTSGVDVEITAINGSVPPFTIADAALDGTVYRWTTSASGSDTDEWGLKQTLLPAGTTSFLVQGENVTRAQSANFDYRFTTSAGLPEIALTMYIMVSAETPVVEPPQPTTAPDAAAAVEASSEEVDSTSDKVDAASSDDGESVAPSDIGDTFVSGDEVIVSDGPVNLRASAGTGAAVLLVLPEGTLLTVVGGPSSANGYNWYQVEIDEAQPAVGWVAVNFISLVSPGGGGGEFEPGGRVMVFDGPLNMRAAADLQSAVLAVLPQDATMTVLSGPVAADGYDWYQVDPDNDANNGWVAADFLSGLGFLVGDIVFVNTDALNVRSAPGTGSSVLGVVLTDTIGEVTDGPESASGLTWYEVDFPSVTGWVAGQFLALSGGPPPTGEFDPQDWIFVFDPPVNLRDAPALDGEILESLPDGEGVQVLSGPTSADGYDWYQVDHEGQEGYVVGEFFNGGWQLDGFAVVADGPINLRSDPGTSGAILQTVPQNEIVFVLTDEPVELNGYLWFKIDIEDGPEGWVAGRYLGEFEV